MWIKFSHTNHKGWVHPLTHTISENKMDSDIYDCLFTLMSQHISPHLKPNISQEYRTPKDTSPLHTNKCQRWSNKRSICRIRWQDREKQTCFWEICYISPSHQRTETLTSPTQLLLLMGFSSTLLRHFF